jgi:hypothetical protein
VWWAMDKMLHISCKKRLLWQRLKQGINCDDVVKEELSIQYSICRLVMVWYNVMCHIAV